MVGEGQPEGVFEFVREPTQLGQVDVLRGILVKPLPDLIVHVKVILGQALFAAMITIMTIIIILIIITLTIRQ